MNLIEEIKETAKKELKVEFLKVCYKDDFSVDAKITFQGITFDITLFTFLNVFTIQYKNIKDNTSIDNFFTDVYLRCFEKMDALGFTDSHTRVPIRNLLIEIAVEEFKKTTHYKLNILYNDEYKKIFS